MVNYRLLAAPNYMNSLVFSHIARHHSAFRVNSAFIFRSRETQAAGTAATTGCCL
jgi:hypothetical protein